MTGMDSGATAPLTPMHSPATAPPTSLWDLPDPCLLAVLRGCTDDHATLFSAARAHSRLHQAAVLALSSVAVQQRTQQQVDSLLLYLDSHGQHVRSISLGGAVDLGATLTGNKVSITRLPNSAELHSLQLHNLDVRLQRGAGVPGVFSAAGSMPLTQLRLSDCTLLDGQIGLVAALAALPGPQHLSACRLSTGGGRRRTVVRFRSTVLQQLQQLTHLELEDGVSDLDVPAGWSSRLPSLQGLTRLVDLRFLLGGQLNLIQPGWLSGCSTLTRLVLVTSHQGVHPGILAGQTQLQHLEVEACSMQGGGVAELLAELQTLQQLTHLSLHNMMLLDLLAGTHPAAAYSALTASSRLQHLSIRGCIFSPGVWHNMFPAGRQLPHLTSLEVQGVTEFSFGYDNGGHAAHPAGSLLVSCCPGLQALDLRGFACSAEHFTPLQGLSRLWSLSADVPAASAGSSWEALAQLTSLRQLVLRADQVPAGSLLQLTRLVHLTKLDWAGQENGKQQYRTWQDGDGGGEPVWRQLLRDHLHHSSAEEPSGGAEGGCSTRV